MLCHSWHCCSSKDDVDSEDGSLCPSWRHVNPVLGRWTPGLYVSVVTVQCPPGLKALNASGSSTFDSQLLEAHEMLPAACFPFLYLRQIPVSVGPMKNLVNGGACRWYDNVLVRDGGSEKEEVVAARAIYL